MRCSLWRANWVSWNRCSRVRYYFKLFLWPPVLRTSKHSNQPGAWGGGAFFKGCSFGGNDVLPVLFLPHWSFHLNISLPKSSSARIWLVVVDWAWGVKHELTMTCPIFARMPGDSNCRRFRSLLLCPLLYMWDVSFPHDIPPRVLFISFPLSLPCQSQCGT